MSYNTSVNSNTASNPTYPTLSPARIPPRPNQPNDSSTTAVARRKFNEVTQQQELCGIQQPQQIMEALSKSQELLEASLGTANMQKETPKKLEIQKLLGNLDFAIRALAPHVALTPNKNPENGSNNNNQSSSLTLNNNNNVNNNNVAAKVQNNLEINSYCFAQDAAVITFQLAEKIRLTDIAQDAFFIVDGTRIGAHQIMFALHCDYYSSSSVSPRRAIIFENVKKEIFEEFLKYIYTGQLKFEVTNFLELYHLANFFKCENLKQSCCSYLYKVLARSNAISLLEKSHSLAPDLYKLIQLYVFSFLKNFQLEEFLVLTEPVFLEMLNQDEFCLPEFEILKLLLLWLNKREKNGDLLPKAKSCLRNSRFSSIADLWKSQHRFTVWGQPFFSPDELGEISQQISAKSSFKPRKETGESWLDQLNSFQVKPLGIDEAIIFVSIPISGEPQSHSFDIDTIPISLSYEISGNNQAPVRIIKRKNDREAKEETLQQNEIKKKCRFVLQYSLIDQSGNEQIFSSLEKKQSFSAKLRPTKFNIQLNPQLLPEFVYKNVVRLKFHIKLLNAKTT